MKKLIFVLILISFSLNVEARDKRIRYLFQKLNPCPANFNRYGPCPGYIVDHIIPLACGGPDSISNMQWQTTLEARLKDKTERKNCLK